MSGTGHAPVSLPHQPQPPPAGARAGRAANSFKGAGGSRPGSRQAARASMVPGPILSQVWRSIPEDIPGLRVAVTEVRDAPQQQDGCELGPTASFMQPLLPILSDIERDHTYTQKCLDSQEAVMNALIAELEKFRRDREAEVKRAVARERDKCKADLASLADLANYKRKNRDVAEQRARVAAQQFEATSAVLETEKAHLALLQDKTAQEERDVQEAEAELAHAISARKETECSLKALTDQYESLVKEQTESEAQHMSMLNAAASMYDEARRLLSDEESYRSPNDTSGYLRSDIQKEIRRQDAIRNDIAWAERTKAACMARLSHFRANLEDQKSRHTKASEILSVTSERVAAREGSMRHEKQQCEYRRDTARQEMEDAAIRESAAKDANFSARKEIDHLQSELESLRVTKTAKANEMERIAKMFEFAEEENERITRHVNALREKLNQNRENYSMDEKFIRQDKTKATLIMDSEIELRIEAQVLVKEATESLRVLREEVESVMGENAVIARESQDLNDELVSKREDLVRRIAELDKELNELEEKDRGLEAELSTHRVELHEFEDEWVPRIDELEQRRAALQESVDAAPLIIRSLEDKITTTNVTHEAFVKKQVSKQEQIETCERMIRSLEERIQLTVAEHKDFVKMYTALVDKIELDKNRHSEHVKREKQSAKAAKKEILAFFLQNHGKADKFAKVQEEMLVVREMYTRVLHQHAKIDTQLSNTCEMLSYEQRARHSLRVFKESQLLVEQATTTPPIEALLKDLGAIAEIVSSAAAQKQGDETERLRKSFR